MIGNANGTRDRRRIRDEERERKEVKAVAAQR
jgi:hypothetical protein